MQELRDEALPTFCIVLPMYNEEENAVSCIETISEFLSGVNVRTGIVAVDDGSRDNTLSILERLKERIPNIYIRSHTENAGYGEANRTGLSAAVIEGYDYALVMDADGTQNPIFIENFFSPMRKGTDLIKATRYSLGGRVEGVPYSRWVISWLGNRLAKLILRLPLADYTNGFRAVHRDLITQLSCEEKSFSYLIEEVVQAKRLGASFAEVPYTLTIRTSVKSKSKFVYSWAVYLNFLRKLFD